ncbi:Structural maintenance of chromosomes protein [Cryptosporidium felis]|nr:Structural maintenance of chromosomes protein [Cryptosporidium felis]
MKNLGFDEPVSVGGECMKPRLIIHKIVLDNFKSYGGKKVIGPFHKSFTAIVGPNGSGKSNVIDAMLFVFGKRAKHMRLNRVSELIHNSKHYPNNEKASVSVHFIEIIDIPGDKHAYEILPGSEIVIRREVQKKSEQTKYYINDKLSSYLEVTKLLSAKGTDLEHNRFLILQGEVELIAQMKPKSTNSNEDGLLEYIEDIIGSSRYIQDIEKNSQELEQLNELRIEKLNRLKIAEKELNALKAPYTTAIEFFSLEREICLTKLLLYMEEYKDTKMQIEALKNEKTKLINIGEEFNIQRAAIEERRAELEKESKETNSKVHALKEKLEKEEAEFKAILLKDEELRATLKNSKKRLSKQEEMMKTEEKAIPELEQKIIDLENEVHEKQKVLPKIVKELESAQEKLEAQQKTLKDIIEETRRKKDKAEQELAPLQRQLLDVQHPHDMLNVELELLKQKQAQRLEATENRKKSKEDISKRIQGLTEQSVELEKKIQANKALLDEKSQELERVQKELNENSKLLGLKKLELDDARSLQTTNCHQEVRAVSESKQKNPKPTLSEAVTKHFSAKNSGVYGKLGDLGTVDEQFRLALSSSVSQLESIVVQTTEDAQEVVEYVRRSNLGRVSCIILDKLSPSLKQNMDKSCKIPESSKRLFELIKVKDPKFRIAWYFAVRETLVTENLDIAAKISYGGKQRWRVVTIDGELIDLSGTMTGGGPSVSLARQTGKKNSSKTQNIPSPEEVKRLEEELEKLQEKCNRARARFKELEDQIGALNSEISQQTLLLKKARIELASIEAERSESADSDPELDSPTDDSTFRGEILRLESEIEALKEKMAKLNASLKQKQAVVDKFTKEMKEVGGPEMRIQVELVQQLTEKLGIMEKEINKNQVDITLSEKKKLRAMESLQQLKSKILSLEDSVKKTETQLVSLEEVALEVIARKKEVEHDLSLHMDEYNSFQTKFEQLEKSLEDLELRDVENCNKLNDISSKISEAENSSTKQLQKKLQRVREDASLIPPLPESGVDDGMEVQRDSNLEPLKTKFLIEDLPDSDYSLLLGEMTSPKLKSTLESLQVQLRTICEKHSAESSTKQFRPSSDIFSQYSAQLQQFSRRNQEVEEATNARDESRKLVDSLRQSRLTEFLSGFRAIASQLKEIYQMITLGGDAELELIDSVDPFSDGIIFSVRPPKKSWRPIHNLSGGEKTLSSLALVFALHQFRPSPLYFMDEVDAALDFRNVSIIATFIKEKTKNAQFIVVSLRNYMFETADRLVGIYKTFDVTKSVSILPEHFSDSSKDRVRSEDEGIEESRKHGDLAGSLLDPVRLEA